MRAPGCRARPYASDRICSARRRTAHGPIGVQAERLAPSTAPARQTRPVTSTPPSPRQRNHACRRDDACVGARRLFCIQPDGVLLKAGKAPRPTTPVAENLKRREEARKTPREQARHRHCPGTPIICTTGARARTGSKTTAPIRVGSSVRIIASAAYGKVGL